MGAGNVLLTIPAWVGRGWPLGVRPIVAQARRAPAAAPTTVTPADRTGTPADGRTGATGQGAVIRYVAPAWVANVITFPLTVWLTVPPPTWLTTMV